MIETRWDSFGGRGLFAMTAIPQGTPMLAIPERNVVYEAASGSFVDRVVDQLPFRNDTVSQRGAWSLGAILATWKLARDHNPISESTIMMERLGITMSAADYAGSLPWKETQWQLPILWDAVTLHQSLIYGCEEVVNARSSSDELTEVLQRDMLDTCHKAQCLVMNLQKTGACLAQELEPALKEEGLTVSPLNVLHACEQSMALVYSRSLLHSSSGKLALIPTIDFANHHASPNAYLQNTVDGVTLVAKESIALDEEITITYGLDSGNGDRSPCAFSSYGFVPQTLANSKDVGGKALQAAIRWGQKTAKRGR